MALFCFVLLAMPTFGAVRISEFLAENDGLLRDEDGDTPDWIELQNDGLATVNLDGWFLTNNTTNLQKWRMPAVTLQGGGFLLVFASGKDRTNGTLHTNFQLDNAGGYLALVQPDGVTIAHQFAAYPKQHPNISYGLEPSGTFTAVGREANARVLVPTDGALGTAWTLPESDDTGWSSATTPVGFALYETTGPGAVVLRLDMNRRGADTNTTTLPGFSPFTIDGTGIITNPTVRTYGAITVTLSNTPGFGYDDRLNAGPNTNGAFTEALLLRDYVYSRSRTNNGGLDITLEGLAPGKAHAITIWSFDVLNPGSRVSDWYANGVLVKDNYTFNAQVLPTNNTQCQFTFEAVSDAGGRIVINARRDASSANLSGQPDYGVFLNALQVAELNYSSFISADLAAAMHGINASAYVRVPFTIQNAANVNELRLRMRYNDGFVAYVNGQWVASANAPPAPAWDSNATAAHGGGGATLLSELFVTNAPGLLRNGPNLLAIQGLNISAADDDFLVAPELDATRVFGFFSTPTPGAPNRPGSIGVVADTKFSVDRGFFETPFSLVITTSTENASIYYTLNGSKPSPTNGALYIAPILITNTTFVRAAAYKSGYIASDIDTHTYIFLDSVLRQPASLPGYPTIWQASYPADYGMDSNVVNDPKYGATIKNDLRSIPTLSIVSDHNGLWSSTTGIYPNSTSEGTNWEREASLELIDGTGESLFATRCALKVHGNASRDNVRTPKHSLHVTFTHEFGPTKLHYDWFGGGVDQHDGIVFRGCGFVDGWAGRYADNNLYTSTETGEVFRGLRYRPENTCYLRDVWTKESFRDMGWNASRSACIHLYINGLYWGLYQPSERMTAAYFQELYGGQEGAWDVLVGEDNNGPPVIVDGSGTDWTNVLNLVNGTVSDATYQAVAQLVDMDNLIDYMIVHIFAESEDWPRHNWYLAHRRATNGVPGTKFICTVWDQELTLDRLVRRNRINVGNGTDGAGELYSPARVYARLRASAEFRHHFGDRVQKHLFNGGALTPSNCVARLLAPAAIIRDALVGESARWGDARSNGVPAGQIGTGKTFTRDEWWQPEIDKLATNFLMKLTADNIARFRAGSLCPNLGAPEFNQFGGAISNDFTLVMTHTNASGVIYFTIDGADPRVFGTGAVATNAQAYAEPLVMNAPTQVKARVLNDTNWSALVDATFYPPQDLSKLALTEIMYNPPALGTNSGDEFEFVELKNTGTNVLDLSGLIFHGTGFTFTNGTKLAPGAFFVLVRNAASFVLKYPGVTVNGVFSGRLDNGGETLRLVHPIGATIFAVTYDDEAPWPVAADNFGFSIVQSGLTQAPDRGSNWRASTFPGGSPGADDPPPNLPCIVINEVLSASVPPLVDEVELFNPTLEAADVSGWFLTDDLDQPNRFRIPDGTQIPAGTYLSFNETQLGFGLNSHGEQIYLLSANTNGALTGYSHGFSFGAAADNVSFGRYINSVGEEQFPAQIDRSFKAANSGPRVGPIVINEIQYHPGLGGDEFIELLNISSTNVPLADAQGVPWGISGAAYEFSPDIIVPPNGYVLIVPIDPAEFRAKYSVPDSAIIVGPYFGVLQDSGERLKLERPGVLDTNGLPFIVVDEVRYNDKAPWPPAADGAGPSLQRLDPRAYGDDPVNWIAGSPTPGTENRAPDTDGDGLPDDWEIANGTDPLLDDAAADPDGDGMTNYAEYRAGTNPHDPVSCLKLRVTWQDGTVDLSFDAKSNRAYEIFARDSLAAGDWTSFREFPAGTERPESTSFVPSPNSTRFFQLQVK